MLLSDDQRELVWLVPRRIAQVLPCKPLPMAARTLQQEIKLPITWIVFLPRPSERPHHALSPVWIAFQTFI